MCEKVTTQTDLFLPGSPSERPYILLDGESRRLSASAELNDLVAHFPESDILWFPQHLTSEAHTNKRACIRGLRYVVLDLDFPLTVGEYTVDALLDRNSALRLPPPSAIVSTGGGFHIYWSIGALHLGRYPTDTSIDRTENRREFFLALYESVTRGLCAAFAEFGADTQAAPATQLFRLPGSYNRKHHVETFVEYEAPYAYTTLKDLKGALDRAATIHGFDVPDPKAIKEQHYSCAPRCLSLIHI